MPKGFRLGLDVLSVSAVNKMVYKCNHVYALNTTTLF